jgi:nitrate/nitrite transporter NarK
MKLFDLKNAGHWPTLLAAFLYFDFSFMVWTVLGPLGAQIGEKLNLSPEQKGLMVALPILAGAALRILLGLLVDRVGAKNAGIMAQLVVITGLALAWMFGSRPTPIFTVLFSTWEERARALSGFFSPLGSCAKQTSIWGSLGTLVL